MDFLSKRINSISNGQKASRRQVVCCLSNSVETSVFHDGAFKLLNTSLSILQREGYIRSFNFSIIKRFVKRKKISYSGVEVNSLYLTINLKYDSVGNSVIYTIFRASTPARRVFITSKSFWQPQTFSGIFVVSTSRGIITDIEARSLNLGGELLFGVV